MADKIFDIRDRSFQFAARIVKLSRHLEDKTGVSRILINQLLAAGTSIGANLQEANSGETDKDFIHKNAISLKEARETNYRLRSLLATNDFPREVSKGIEELQNESLELTKIIAKIIVNKKKNQGI